MLFCSCNAFSFLYHIRDTQNTKMNVCAMQSQRRRHWEHGTAKDSLGNTVVFSIITLKIEILLRGLFVWKEEMAQSTFCQYKARDPPPLVVFPGWSKAWAVLPAGTTAEQKQEYHSSHHNFYRKTAPKNHSQ